jgi:hypothetical protein
MTNNADWKASRAQIHHTISADKTQQWRWKQLRAAHVFARSLLDDPANIWEHTRTYAMKYTLMNDLPFRSVIGSTILNVTYDIRVQGKDDYWINLAELANQFGSDTVNGGTYLVEVLPIRARFLVCILLSTRLSYWFRVVRHIPAWFPGAQFKRDALYHRKIGEKVLHEPFEFVKAKLVRASFVYA